MQACIVHAPVTLQRYYSMPLTTDAQHVTDRYGLLQPQKVKSSSFECKSLLNFFALFMYMNCSLLLLDGQRNLYALLGVTPPRYHCRGNYLAKLSIHMLLLFTLYLYSHLFIYSIILCTHDKSVFQDVSKSLQKDQIPVESCQRSDTFCKSHVQQVKDETEAHMHTNYEAALSLSGHNGSSEW